MALGMAYLRTDVDYDPGGDLELGGGGGAVSFMLGGSPSPGLTIGGGFWVASVDDPASDSSVDEFDSDASLTQVLVGPFVDVFPRPRHGFHIGGALGFAFIQLPEERESRQDRAALTSGGAGGALFGGYDFWVSADWSLGAMLRLMATHSREDSTLLYDTTSRSFALSFTGLYH
jgi:hypothetical protein